MSFGAGTSFTLYAVVVHIIITTVVVLLMLPVHVQGGAPKEQLGMSTMCVMRPVHLWVAGPLSLPFFLEGTGTKISSYGKSVFGYA